MEITTNVPERRDAEGTIEQLGRSLTFNYPMPEGLQAKVAEWGEEVCDAILTSAVKIDVQDVARRKMKQVDEDGNPYDDETVLEVVGKYKPGIPTERKRTDKVAKTLSEYNKMSEEEQERLLRNLVESRKERQEG